jgi:outer membrane protein OmpA-like peptidoglycan-associated protein
MTSIFSYAALVSSTLAVLALSSTGTVLAQSKAAGMRAEVIDIGHANWNAKVVSEGLFPEDACEQLKAAGFKCMGFRPSVRFSLPTTNFRVGSADLPDGLKPQLAVLADVLRDKRGSNKIVQIEGHADASGSPEANLALSVRRAEEVVRFLVERGADPTMLRSTGQGSAALRNSQNPLAPENRRVEIGRLDQVASK